MKFKVGDKVRVRQWADMVKEHGIRGSYITGPINVFSVGMRDYCGEVLTISEVDDGVYSMEEESDSKYSWFDWMFEGKEPHWVEVRHFEFEAWEKRILVVDLGERCDRRYICVHEKYSDEYIGEGDFRIVPWKYMREIEECSSKKTIEELEELVRKFKARCGDA